MHQFQVICSIPHMISKHNHGLLTPWDPTDAPPPAALRPQGCMSINFKKNHQKTTLNYTYHYFHETNHQHIGNCHLIYI